MGGIGLFVWLWVALLISNGGKVELCRVAEGAHNLCEQQTEDSSLTRRRSLVKSVP